MADEKTLEGFLIRVIDEEKKFVVNVEFSAAFVDTLENDPERGEKQLRGIILHAMKQIRTQKEEARNKVTP